MNLTESKKVCREVTTVVSTERGECKLTYTLTVVQGKGDYGNIFSITVARADSDGAVEQTAYDITRQPDRADALFDVLSGSCVTPYTLLEVLSELL